MKIIANMVVRNEADAYLPQVLKRLLGQVDVICLTDDCSDDNTVEVAKSFGARVQVMPEPTFTRDEGLLRQTSWDWLEQNLDGETDALILAIDADEELYETQHPLSFLAQRVPEASVFNVQFFHMWSPTHFRIDKLWRPHPSTRVFRYMPGGQFNRRQLACGSEPTYVVDELRAGRYFVRTGLVMKHLSYIKDEDKQAKYDRYSKIDGGAFHANSHIESIMDPIDQVVLEPFEWE